MLQTEYQINGFFDKVQLIMCKFTLQPFWSPLLFCIATCPKHWLWKVAPCATTYRLRIKHVLNAVDSLYTSAPNKYKFPVLHPLKGYE